MRRVLGILLIIGAAVVVATGYLTVPSASTCAAANKINLELGQPLPCSTTPGSVYFAAGAVLLIGGLLLVLTRRRRLTSAH